MLGRGVFRLVEGFAKAEGSTGHGALLGGEYFGKRVLDGLEIRGVRTHRGLERDTRISRIRGNSEFASKRNFAILTLKVQGLVQTVFVPFINAKNYLLSLTVEGLIENDAWSSITIL